MEWIGSLVVLVVYFATILFVIVDAPENSKNPMLFWVIATVLFSVFGLLAYLLFGREWPDDVSPGSRKGQDRRPWEE